MFLVQTLYKFSASTLKQQQQQQKVKSTNKQQNQKIESLSNALEINKQEISNQKQQEIDDKKQSNHTQQKIGNQKQKYHNIESNNQQDIYERNYQQDVQKGKRQRSKSQQRKLLQSGQDKQEKNYQSKISKNPQKKSNDQNKLNQNDFNQQNQNKQVQSEVVYLNFQSGQKILVIEAYQNGWWYGNTLKSPDCKGFFPSNYVKIGSKPQPPPPQAPPQSQSQQQEIVYDPQNQQGVHYVQNELKNLNKGAIESSYYLGIKGYKNVKIDQKNQNILKGDHVKFDVSTGLAKVPIKDQAPAAKSVRQMGYYFDYHQWTEARNQNPSHKARPDIKRKKPKKLNLKGMD